MNSALSYLKKYNLHEKPGNCEREVNEGGFKKKESGGEEG